MDATIERECSALGGLFQQIITDMKVRGRFRLLGSTDYTEFHVPSMFISKICLIQSDFLHYPAILFLLFFSFFRKFFEYLFIYILCYVYEIFSICEDFYIVGDFLIILSLVYIRSLVYISSLIYITVTLILCAIWMLENPLFLEKMTFLLFRVN